MIGIGSGVITRANIKRIATLTESTILTLSDNGTYFRYVGAEDIVVTVDNSLPTKGVVVFRQAGIGSITLAASGVVLNGTTGVDDQHSTIALIKASDGVYDVLLYNETGADTSNFVPYTGAIDDVNLATYNLTANDVTAERALVPEVKTNTTTPTDLTITTGANKTMLLNTPVWADIDFPIIIRNTGAGRPTLSTLNGNITMPAWEVGDYNQCESQELIHEWKEGTEVSWHIHLTTNGTDGTDRYVKFELEYAYTEDGKWIFPAVYTTPDILIPADTPDRKQMIIPITTFTPTNSLIGDHVVAYLKRVASDGAAPTNPPFIPMLQMHIQKDTAGSRSMTTK